MSLGAIEAIVGVAAFLILAAWFPWGALLQQRYTRMGAAEPDEDDSDDWNSRSARRPA